MTNTDLGLEVSPRQAGTKSRDGLIFVITMWLLSRSVIAIHQSPDITGQPVPKGEEIASLSYNYVLRVMTP
ncbi:MAG: hypothetical protein JGK31_30820, partial [Microcoleus sp. PH2017_30_WIL_O_A]|nr:hypothetical protein [Microcoleus sp. PH2017_30_WIL_O_A]